jgi:hypothetical protein
MIALFNYQFHFIAKIDDKPQLTFDNICVHDKFSNSLKAKPKWSNNVQEERDSPWQMMMESMYSE